MKTTKIEPHKSSLGMDANIMAIVIFVAMAAIAWIPFLKWIAWGVPIVFFILEKESKFVKFQASTALVIGIIQAIINIVLQIFIWILTPKNLYGYARYLTGRGWGAWTVLGIFSTIISIAITLVIIYIIYMSYTYKQVELPVIGPIAEKASKIMENINVNQSSGSTPVNNTPTDAAPAQTPATDTTPAEAPTVNEHNDISPN